MAMIAACSDDEDGVLDEAEEEEAFLRYAAERMASCKFSATTATTTCAALPSWAMSKPILLPGMPPPIITIACRRGELDAIAATGGVTTATSAVVTGVDVWPSSFALAALLLQQQTSLQEGPAGHSPVTPEKSHATTTPGWALELGAGTGIAGMTLARAADPAQLTSVVLTDRSPEALQLLRHNVAANCANRNGHGGRSGSLPCSVARLAWEDVGSGSSSRSCSSRSSSDPGKDSGHASSALAAAAAAAAAAVGAAAAAAAGASPPLTLMLAAAPWSRVLGAALPPSPGPLRLLIGADLLYGGPVNGRLLLGCIDGLLARYGDGDTRILLAMGCRRRSGDRGCGSGGAAHGDCDRDDLDFLEAARARGYRTSWVREDAWAEQLDGSGLDAEAIDIVEMRPPLPPGTTRTKGGGGGGGGGGSAEVVAGAATPDSRAAVPATIGVVSDDDKVGASAGGPAPAAPASPAPPAPPAPPASPAPPAPPAPPPSALPHDGLVELIPSDSSHPGAGAFLVHGAVDESVLERLDALRLQLPLDAKKRPTAPRRFYADDDRWVTSIVADALRRVGRFADRCTNRATSSDDEEMDSNKEKDQQQVAAQSLTAVTDPAAAVAAAAGSGSGGGGGGGLVYEDMLPWFRFIEYADRGKLDPHTDGSNSHPATHQKSTATFLLYLSTCEVGGETELLETVSAGARVLASVRPRRGTLFVFPQKSPHAGRVVYEEEPKVALRGELISVGRA